MQNDLRRAGRWALRSRGCVRGRLRRPGDAPLDGKRAPRRGCMAIEGGGTHSGVKRRVSSSMSNDSRNATAASICFDSVTVAMSSVGIRRNYSFSATVFSCNFCIEAYHWVAWGYSDRNSHKPQQFFAAIRVTAESIGRRHPTVRRPRFARPTPRGR